MSEIKVTNNTNFPIHIAMSWKGIIQYFENDLLPGEEHNFDKFGTGWSDFTAVIASPDNKFSYDGVAANVAGLVGIGISAIVATAGLILIPVTGGVSTTLTAGALATITTISAVTAIAGSVITLGGIVLEGIDGVMQPASFKALFVSDRYKLSVEGGDLIGSPKTDENGEVLLDENGNATLIVTEIKPLVVKWTNLTSGKSGTAD